MKEQYNHRLGIEVKSHLLNLGIETIRDSKYYQITDHDRIRAIAKNVREINLVMGVVTDEMQSIKIAREIYGANKGLSYTYASWQHNIKVFRWLSIFSCAVTFVYDLIYLGYVLAIAELVAIAVIVAVMIKEKVGEKKIENNQVLSFWN